MAESTELWERQPNESPEAFQAFATYRDMPIPRSCAWAGQALGKSTTLMERWSSAHDWPRRILGERLARGWMQPERDDTAHGPVVGKSNADDGGEIPK